MPGEDCNKKYRWEIVSELKADGSCSTPSDSRGEVPLLSSDDESGSCNSTGTASGVEKKKSLPVRYRLPTESHETPSPLPSRESASSLPLGRASSSPHISPGLDPSYARPRIVHDLLDLSTLSKLSPNSSPEQLGNGILEGKKHRQNAYLSGGIKVSTARNQAEFHQETYARSGQKTNPNKQDAHRAEYRKIEDPEETDDSMGLGNTDTEYTW